MRISLKTVYVVAPASVAATITTQAQPPSGETEKAPAVSKPAETVVTTSAATVSIIFIYYKLNVCNDKKVENQFKKFTVFITVLDKKKSKKQLFKVR